MHDTRRPNASNRTQGTGHYHTYLVARSHGVAAMSVHSSCVSYELAGASRQIRDQLDTGRKGHMLAEGEGGAMHEMALG